ncbi:MAG: FAD-binding protein [Rhodocyclaceae bacterium]|nr:FAD-binding protein [Rhodocyclaceae bacterium]
MSLRGELQHEVRMAALSAWGVGGVAAAVYTPADEADASTFLAGLRLDEPLLVHGSGAYIVVREGGYGGMVMSTRALQTVTLEGDELYAEVGVPCARLAHVAHGHAFDGMGWMAGLPGTLGGALVTNAGVRDRRMWAHVAAVRTLDRSGHAHRRKPESFGVGPVHAGASHHPGEVIVGAWLRADLRGDGGASAGELSGPRAVSQLFAVEDVLHVLDVADQVPGRVRLDRASGQLHLDAQPDAVGLEAAIRGLCEAASVAAGRPVHCRLRFVGEPLREGSRG